MQFEPQLLPPGTLPWTWVIAGVLLVLALPGLGALRARPERLHLLLGAGVALAVLWSISAL